MGSSLRWPYATHASFEVVLEFSMSASCLEADNFYRFKSLDCSVRRGRCAAGSCSFGLETGSERTGCPRVVVIKRISDIRN
jgi:hypothetical protein